MQRRDFLNSTLLASGSVLLNGMTPLTLLAEQDWTGFSGVGDYALSNGNTYAVMTAGHAMRDAVYNRQDIAINDTQEEYDCVVIGGGISGLAAALFVRRQHPNARYLVLDNHPVFGGEAKRNEFEVDGQRLLVHQGSAACFPPLTGDFLAGFYDSIGIDWTQFRYQSWAGPEAPKKIENTPYAVGGNTAGFFFGAKFGHPEGLWVRDPWGTQLRAAPISETAKRELLGMRSADLKPFSEHRYQPKTHGDAASRHLDSVTLEQHLIAAYGLSQETVRTYLSPISGGGSGLGADALSAYCEYAADVLLPWDYKQEAQMFPGGNAGVARQIVKQLIPSAISGDASMAGVCRGAIQFEALDQAESATRLRLDSTVISVRHDGDPNRAERVDVTYERAKKLYRVRARTAVMAGGSWTAKHVLPDLPARQRAAYAQFHRAPCLMANVAVRNWRFLDRLGMTECRWFEGIGNSMTVRRVATFGDGPKTIDPETPTVLTLKILFSQPGLPLEEQTVRGRMKLLSTSFRQYEQLIRDQFTRMFASTGFDANRDIAGIILNRWGHAYLSPQPGFFFGRDGQPGPGEILRQHPHGRIAFANSDLSGIMDHRMSILEARRAVSQLRT